MVFDRFPKEGIAQKRLKDSRVNSLLVFHAALCVTTLRNEYLTGKQNVWQERNTSIFITKIEQLARNMMLFIL